jgi:DNA-binding CsgD family transcriptional regulator|tara:strand:+ start:1016 stop:2764 length:1749 start_codon:yes stop_codon:yes gene_type:complete
MSKINYSKYLFLVLLTSHSLVVSQVLDQQSINLEKVDLKSANDSMIKYKQVNPQKSLNFGLYALNSFKDEILTLDFVNTNYYLGETFFYVGDDRSSFEYLSKSLQLYSLLEPNKRRNRNVIKPPWILVLMGNVYFRNKEYSNAEKFYYEALENFKLFDPIFDEEKYYGTATSLGNLALIKVEKKEYELALEIYDEVSDLRVKNGDTVEILSSYLAYMELYLQKGDDEMFLEYYNKLDNAYKAYSSNMANNDPEFFLVFSMVNRRYAEFLKYKGRVSESLEYLFKAKKNAVNLEYEIPKINLEISNVFFNLGMNDDAKNLILENLNLDQLNQAQKINNFKLLEKIFTSEKSIEDLLKVKDSIILYNEQPTQIFLNNEFNALESLMLVSEKQNDLNISKSINNRNTLVSIFLVAILFLIAVSLRFNYDLQKEKNTRLRLEKDKINEELKLKRRQLFSKINFISQRNDYLNSIRNQLDGDITSTKNLKSIKREIKNITTSEQAYEEFDKMFSQVYPNFYKRLNLTAKLSQTDIRLASYIKMNHSNNEISRISGISLRTVESQRYRLSKKLNLVKGQDLNRFILNI